MSITVSVTAKDIRAGKAGNCFLCPLAIALHRATGDDHAQIFERDWELRAEAWSRSVPLPWQAVEFVRTFDGLIRERKGKPVSALKHVQPFQFELPDLGSDEWLEACHGCEQFFKTAKLDDEGYCQGCKGSDD